MRLDNTTSTLLLLGIGGLSSVAFLRATDVLTNLVCVAAGLGWTAWWYVRPTAEPEADGETVETVEVQEGSAPQDQSGGDEQPKAKKARASGQKGAAEASSKAGLEVGPLVTDVKAALAEADQAVSVAIGAFIKIAEEAQQISECAGEMMRWRQNTTPVIQETINHLTERCGVLSDNLNEVIVAFQFHDGLSQRLQHTAASLEEFAALSSGKQDASIPAHTRKLNSQPANYDSQSVSQDATLF